MWNIFVINFIIMLLFHYPLSIKCNEYKHNYTIPEFIKGPANTSNFDGTYIFKEYVIIGMFSICARSNNIDSTGLAHHIALGQYFSLKLSHKAFTYISYDICQDLNEAQEVSVSMMLDKAYHNTIFDISSSELTPELVRCIVTKNFTECAVKEADTTSLA